MKKVLAAAVLIMLSLIGLTGCNQPMEPIEISVSVNPSFLGEAAFNVALEKQFFKEEGLELEVIEQNVGWHSFRDLLEGRADICHVADLPIVYQLYNPQQFTTSPPADFKILADLVFTNKIQRVVVRRDAGIDTARDFVGARVGTVEGSTLDIFLDYFLRENSIGREQVTILDYDIEGLSDALVSGEVDAIVSWQPHVYRVMQRLGGRAELLESELNFTTSWLAVINQARLKEQPEIAVRYLRALQRAVTYIQENPEESIRIHSRGSAERREILQKLWTDIDFKLSLSESLLTTFQQEARWIIRNSSDAHGRLPDFTELFYFDAIEEIAPEGITIIR